MNQKMEKKRQLSMLEFLRPSKVMRKTSNDNSPSQWKIKWIPHLEKISQKTLPFSVRNTTECKDITKKKIPEVMVMKVRMKPTQEQREVLKQWIGTSRLMYNRALDLVRGGEKINFQTLRNKLVPKKNIDEKEQWLKKVPNCVKQGGVKQLVLTFQTNFAKKEKKKNNNSDAFKIHFRSKILSSTSENQRTN
mmetsp:Transcript_23562/g.32962  ORF Transcript_23562/g.32962 Transcript_23562/m.32962 type:complete len:192 (+) Transcript_23562:1-576(+)